MIKPYARWMIRKDLPDVLEIEQLAFDYPWSEDDFLRCLRQRTVVGSVVEVNDVVCGFVIYDNMASSRELLNLAVHPSCRRRGLGSFVMDWMKRKVNGRRRRLAAKIREANVPAQLFFAHHGFRCHGTLHGEYKETDEDAYVFIYEMAKVRFAEQPKS